MKTLNEQQPTPVASNPKLPLMHTFKVTINLIGVNPYVSVPEPILLQLFKDAGKNKGHIPIKGTINRKPYLQTLVKYSGEWRLYINTTMLKDSPKRIGEIIEVEVCYDPESREIAAPEPFIKALNNNTQARQVFDGLPASRRLEIVRYLSRLKNKETLDKNIQRAIGFLQGKERFIGRDTP